MHYNEGSWGLVMCNGMTRNVDWENIIYQERWDETGRRGGRGWGKEGCGGREEGEGTGKEG